jgi:hypothetical protein
MKFYKGFRHGKDGTLANQFSTETKLRFSLQVLLVVALCSCVHKQASRIKSGWYPLTKAQDISCTSWPLRDKDLKVEEIVPFHDDNPGFFVSFIKRNGAKSFYFAPMERDVTPKPSRFVPLDLPRGALLLGGTTIKGNTHSIFLTGESDRVVLETRNLYSGLQGQRIPIAIKGYSRGRVIEGKGGDWLVIEDESGQSRVYFLAFDSQGNRTLKPVQLEIEEGAKIALIQGRLLASYRDYPQSHILHITWINTSDAANADHGSPIKHQLDLGGAVEAWSLGTLPSGPILAAIVGDSLVGDANLVLVRLDLNSKNGKLQLIGKVDLRDIHVSEPLFSETPKGTELMLANWVDEESTIARYIVKSEGLSKPIFSGLFAKGAHLVGLLQAKETDRIQVLTRHRIESQWVYQVCGL